MRRLDVTHGWKADERAQGVEFKDLKDHARQQPAGCLVLSDGSPLFKLALIRVQGQPLTRYKDMSD